MAQLSDFLGSGAANAAYQLAYANATTFDAVIQGDPLAMQADGTVTAALPPSDPNYAIRPLSQVGDLNNTATKNTVTTTGSADKPVLLTNGNVVVPLSAVTTTYPQFSIYAPSGALITTVTTESVAASVTPKVAALTGGGFTIAYRTAAGLRFGVYDNTGAVVTALATLTASVTNVMGVLALSGGGFSLLYSFNSSGNIASTAAFNAAGVQQGTTTAIETIPATDQFNTALTGSAMVQYGASGGYCIAYNFSTGSQSSFFVRVAFFSSSAVLQNSLIAVNTTSIAQPKLAALTDGTVVLGYNRVGTASGSFYLKYSATGVQVVAATAIDAGSVTSFTVTALSSATFAIFYVLSTDLIQRLYDINGAIVGGALTYTGSFGASSNNMDVQKLSDGTFLAAISITASASTPRAARLNAALTTLLAGAIVLDATNANLGSTYVYVVPVVNPATAQACAMSFYSGTLPDFRFANFVAQVKARTFIGVATAAAAAATSVRMQVIGPALMTKTFAPAQAVNYQANAIPGQKASLIGTTAILLGVQ